ncbi:hypothetical protein QCA50_015527 [Cerrena zonata]|uniref:Uncharacterized protein n=1 Tax=Cerrena zonata TaxID=2478898 RepID=A0AAW0FJ25_9APHY
MAKSKNTKYNFSPAQCIHLEAILPDYIECLKDEDADGCDQAIAEVTGTICKEAGIQDDSKKESVTTSVRQWLIIKSSEVKRSRVIKPFELTGIQSFHAAKWESDIKPIVLRKFTGPNPNKQKYWLKEIMIARDTLWAGLEDDDRTMYETRAREFNEGTIAKETKALYGDKHFEEELQKVLNRFGNIFDAKIIAVTVREGTEGIMSSILESKGTSKFVKTLPEHQLFQWTPAEYLTHSKAELGAAPDDGSTDTKKMALTYDEGGNPIIPPGPYENQTGILRNILAEYVRICYNKAAGKPNAVTGPPWGAMHGPWTQYIDPKYFPSRSSLPDDFDFDNFQLERVFTMPIELVLELADHLVKRQDKKSSNELPEGEEVFAWKVYLSAKKNWTPAGQPDTEPADGKKRRRKRAEIQRRKKVRVSTEGEEEIVKGLDDLDGPDGSVSGDDLDTAMVGRKGKGSISKGSPASVGESWDEKVEYLRSLSNDNHYRQIIQWLDTSQTCSQLDPEAVIPQASLHVDQRIPGWSLPIQYLPEHIHGSQEGNDLVEIFLSVWENNYATLWGMEGCLEEYALLTGQLIRDIRICQFAHGDAEDPWPSHLPLYLSNTEFNINTECRISRTCENIWQNICACTQAALLQNQSLITTMMAASGAPTGQSSAPGPSVAGPSAAQSSASGPSTLHLQEDQTFIVPSATLQAANIAMIGMSSTNEVVQTLGQTDSLPPLPRIQPIKKPLPKPRQPERKRKDSRLDLIDGQSDPAGTNQEDPTVTNRFSDHTVGVVPAAAVHPPAAANPSNNDSQAGIGTAEADLALHRADAVDSNTRHSKRLQVKPKTVWQKGGTKVTVDPAILTPDVTVHGPERLAEAIRPDEPLPDVPGTSKPMSKGKKNRKLAAGKKGARKGVKK